MFIIGLNGHVVPFFQHYTSQPHLFCCPGAHAAAPATPPEASAGGGGDSGSSSSGAQQHWSVPAAGRQPEPAWPQFQEGDAHLSYLPLAHIYERALLEAAIALGARVGFWQVSGSEPLVGYIHQ